MFIVGLTGGIGSGKSAVSERFKTFGITVVDADLASREVVKPGKPALEEIKNHFGESILNDEGNLHRRKLREIIVSDDKQRQWLESVLHPRIGEQVRKELEDSSSVYTLYVAPLLLESNGHQICSRVLVVDVPIEIQISRTCSRDQVSIEQVEKIISSQISRKERLKKADDIISNDGTIEEMEAAVDKLHKKYLELTNK